MTYAQNAVDVTGKVSDQESDRASFQKILLEFIFFLHIQVSADFRVEKDEQSKLTRGF